MNYSTGLVTGSLCRPLCDTKEIVFRKCLGHGVKLYVLEAEWNGATIVLKTPKILGTKAAVSMADGLMPMNVRREGYNMSVKEFVFHVRC